MSPLKFLNPYSSFFPSDNNDLLQAPFNLSLSPARLDDTMPAASKSSSLQKSSKTNKSTSGALSQLFPFADPAPNSKKRSINTTSVAPTPPAKRAKTSFEPPHPTTKNRPFTKPPARPGNEVKTSVSAYRATNRGESSANNQAPPEPVRPKASGKVHQPITSQPGGQLKFKSAFKSQAKPSSTSAKSTVSASSFTGQDDAKPNRSNRTSRDATAPKTGAQGSLPTTAAHANEKRSLRSEVGGFRKGKSDLANYFPDYDEVVFGGGQEDPDAVVPETLLLIVDDRPFKKELKNASPRAGNSKLGSTDNEPEATSRKVEHQSKEQTDTAITRIDLSIYQEWANEMSEDPLDDERYHSSHKRSEKKEKQMRNIDKEHAMHEKSELERLQAELKGPDWLRTLGVSGITESEKKQFEPKREEFIKRVQGLLDKFGKWKEQERDLKARRERELARRREAEEDEEDEDEEEEEEGEEEADAEEGIEQSDVDSTHRPDTHNEGKSSISRKRKRGAKYKNLAHNEDDSVDASAIQLHREAGAAAQSSGRLRKPEKKSRLVTPSPIAQSPPPVPNRPFTSFFSKPHLRDAAMGKVRRGRKVLAFGEPVPDVGEQDFTLPDGFASEKIVKANSRKRRRMNREAKQ